MKHTKHTQHFKNGALNTSLIRVRFTVINKLEHIP
jgi:hypothetical protein